MKQSLIHSMAWLHTWGGLFFGWLLVPIFLAGTIAVFEPELGYWMQPELRMDGAARSSMEQLRHADGYLRTNAPDADAWFVGLAQPREPVLTVGYRRDGKETEQHFDPATLQPLPEPRATEGGHFFTHFHAELDLGTVGVYLVGLAGMALLAALISGVVIHKKIFKDFFTFRPTSSPQRAWLDAHNATGVLTLPFLLMIAYTGVAISFMTYIPVGIPLLFDGDARAPRASVVRNFDRPASGVPAALQPLESFLSPAEAVLGAGKVISLSIDHPGDEQALVEALRDMDDRLSAVADRAAFDGTTGQLVDKQVEWNAAAYSYRAMVGLHIARFGGHVVYWLYFLLGVAGTIMMAAGLVVFTEKRVPENQTVPSRFDSNVARINVAVTAGAIIASIAYLWANRLIPAAASGRETWEIRVFFLVWLATFIHSVARRPKQAWVEQLTIAAVMCALLPVVNFICTPEAALPAAPNRGDAIRAGVDLTALVFAGLFAWTASKLARHRAKSPATRRSTAQTSAASS